uniref:Uncharacterized protein n=1 Tax=Globodera rostochiensis TaxID=31243 RepID=A0A914HPZ5_GLORO
MGLFSICEIQQDAPPRRRGAELGGLLGFVDNFVAYLAGILVSRTKHFMPSRNFFPEFTPIFAQDEPSVELLKSANIRRFVLSHSFFGFPGLLRFP